VYSESLNFQEIDRSLENILGDMPPEFISGLKSNFERNIRSFVGGSVKLELRLVVDSNSVISNLLGFAKTGESVLHKLIHEPFLRLYAPSTLQKEVEENLGQICAEKKLDENRLITTLRRDILPKITILDPTQFSALLSSYLVVGMRDLTDVPFVALHFQLGTHGIITRDKDITEQPRVKTWQLRRVGNVIMVFKKGVFSFLVYSKLLPNVLLSVFKIATAVLRAALEVLIKIVRFFVNLAEGTVKAISKMPDWAQLLLIIAAVVIIFEEKARNALMNFLKEVGEMIFKFASEVYSQIKNLLQALAPFVHYALNILAYLFNCYQETMNQLRSL